MIKACFVVVSALVGADNASLKPHQGPSKGWDVKLYFQKIMFGVVCVRLGFMYEHICCIKQMANSILVFACWSVE